MMYGNHIFVIPILICTLLSLALACNGTQPKFDQAQAELDTNRTSWGHTGASDYKYEYRVLCECSDNLGQTVKVTVSDGNVVSVVYAESGEYGKLGDPPMAAGSPRYHTIDGLFDLIQTAIMRTPDQLIVRYDGEFGYPTNIEIDYWIDAIDDEYTLVANAYAPQ